MSAIDQLFTELRGAKRKALMPFVTAGDPEIDTTEAILRSLAGAGADLCELGVPYSDPIADGPVIQSSYQRALESGFKLQQVFEMGKRMVGEVAMPRVTMVSYSIIHRVGVEAYVQKAVEAGYAGAIVPDLLVEEATEFAQICKAADFSLIQLVTPTTPKERQVRIAKSSSGFLYYVSVTGITGERTALPSDLVDKVTWLRGETDLPICIGFGISSPETAATLAPVADGLIVGSAIVRRIAQAEGKQDAVEKVSKFVQQLRSAIDAV
ncbi:tryptophan synthase subunit alpha [Novipirellula artificiosorum]|uniref:Tryptophan synthase alpha chain n=1 Tax=Novipirellula artificiosorum TaxID=2528016 RepID=A0A5C6E563_9BACT|nr:tryptophan synthase subunit alpha [Novipirellula artificiosorum]TWU42299.1 Tryptophan synthase alpha chain [Novipirellula artificiosorum]